MTDSIAHLGPDGSWYRGESIDYVRNLLFRSDARINDYFDPTVVRELVKEHLDGKENRRLLIWSLISVENWLRTFIR